MRVLRQSLLAYALLCAGVIRVGSLPQNRQPSPPASPQTPQVLDISDILPVGEIHVEAMRVESSPRLTEIGRKFMAAAQKRPVWFMAQVKKAKPGQPIPYSPKLGLTKAEYKELMNASPAQMYLRKVGDGSLTIKAEGTRRIFDGGADLTDFTGIEVDVANRIIKTPHGVLRKSTPFKANSGQAVIGQWSGVEWRLENVPAVHNAAALSATIVEFSLGKVKASGKTQIRYRVQQIKAGKPKENFEYILRCDAALKPVAP